MPADRAAVPRPTEGKLALLVLYDSTQPEAGHLPQTLYPALNHFGLPYRTLDLASARLTAERLAEHSAVVIAQEHLGLGFRGDDLKVLLQAVEDGLGLVNFDYDLPRYGDELARALGLSGARHDGRFAFDGAEALAVRDNEHYLSHTQDAGAEHRLRLPVPVLLARASGQTRALLELPQGTPGVVATRIGRGRVVQWLMSPKLWLHQHFGHAMGLDDLFWKGIVWAARKPFVMKAMPPFVRLRFDDCNGLWREAEDLAFLDVLNEYGHVPNVCICMEAIAPSAAARIKQLHDAGRAEFAPHTLRAGVSLFMRDATRNGPEYTEAEIRANLEQVDDLFEKWDVTYSRILSDHDHEYSWRAVQPCLERGIVYKMNITMPGEVWEGVHVDWQPAPYGLMDWAFDYLPDGVGMFAVYNHGPTFETARTYLPDGRFLYNRAGGFGPYKWDMLNGLTTRDLPANDIPAAAERLAGHLRLGLNSLFFGGSITHSHFIEALSLGEWRVLMDRAQARMTRQQQIYKGYDFIADYARGHVDTHLALAESEGGTVRCRVDGRADVPLQLYVFADREDAVDQRFEEIGTVEARREVTFGAGGNP